MATKELTVSDFFKVEFTTFDRGEPWFDVSFTTTDSGHYGYKDTHEISIDRDDAIALRDLLNEYIEATGEE